MLRRILIALEEYDYSRVALNYATNLVPRPFCHLTGLSILDLPSIEKSIGPVPLGGTYHAERQKELRTIQEKKLAQQLENEFQNIVQEKKISFEIIYKEGNPEDILIEQSKYHDLLVMGIQTSFRYGTEKDRGLQEQVISHGICPVLMIPPSYRDVKKILLCYDGHPQSTRSIHQFIQFNICCDREFTLVNVNNDAVAGRRLLDQMSEYLKIYEITAKLLCLKGDPEKVIPNLAKENNIDLVVLGAYGKPGIFKFFFGSTAKTLLEQNDLPLFIYH